MSEPPEAGEPRGRLEEALRARRDALESLRADGVEPFALGYEPSAHATDLHDRYADLAPASTTEDRVAVAGRVVLLRRHGKLSFVTLRDATGDIQLLLSEEAMGPNYGLVRDLDLGDIVGADGVVATTKRGELSVKASELTLLTKALRPMPEKWHGLKDPELQQRQRHLQLLSDLDARRIVTARAQALRAVRELLDSRGFVEVETPVLQPVAGGAMARPFVTHHHVLDTDLFLRISLELYLKRLLVGGLERIYEIGRNFRNEGIDRSHNPEFTMLEVYQAYGDYFSMMELTQAMVRAAALAVTGSERVTFRGTELDVGADWDRVTVLGSVSEQVGEEVTLERADLAPLAERHGVKVDPNWGPGKVALEMFEKLV